MEKDTGFKKPVVTIIQYATIPVIMSTLMKQTETISEMWDCNFTLTLLITRKDVMEVEVVGVVVTCMTCTQEVSGSNL